MIIPSIDLQGGQTVQLIGGQEKAIDAGDPLPIAAAFGVVGEIAVIDLDAAMGTGDNRTLVESVLRQTPCRIGGGIRTLETALYWLDKGAQKIIIGTAAHPELLQQLPKDRVIVALDARHGEVVVEGWQKNTGTRIAERMAALKDLAGGFMVTFVEREGRMQGIDLAQVAELAQAVGDAKLTVAGGVTTVEEVAAIDQMGVDVQVGMALYTGRMQLSDAIMAMLKSDRPDGLWPTVVVDEAGVALGLTYSSRESLTQAITTRQGVYQSRTRGLWIKGATSGAVQQLLRVDMDCDRDALRFTVRQQGAGFCHHNTWTCFGQAAGMPELARRVAERMASAPDGSYTQRLFADKDLLRSKLIEEAGELAAAETPSETIHEAADVLYFTLVHMARAGISLSDVEAELNRRALRVVRRPGNAKRS